MNKCIMLVEKDKNRDCIKKYAIFLVNNNKASVVERIKSNDGVWMTEHHYTEIVYMSSQRSNSVIRLEKNPTIIEAVSFFVSVIALITAFVK